MSCLNGRRRVMRKNTKNVNMKTPGLISTPLPSPFIPSPTNN